MCGICGIIYDDPSRAVDRSVLEKMNRTMTHRGPDDEGYYLGRGAGLAMRRLSIIDVAGGHQPMTSGDGRIIGVCNGEIYNFEDMRSDLQKKGHTFLTRSDAEVIPHLYEEEGSAFVSELNGMFGLAVWDERERRVIVARDRMGQKPIYWTRSDDALIFASELKAILAYPTIQRNIDSESLAKYLAYEYVPAPHTIFENIYKLEAGFQLIGGKGIPRVQQYWDVPMGSDSCGMSEKEAEERLLELLELSVKRRLISDVPLGVFLSGGVDSSTMVAMMSRLMPADMIKTFSIGFAEKSFDESSHAKRVAEFFGTEHHEQLCTPDDLLRLMPEVTDLLDEPFADPSIIPTYALSKFTREHVTVALGGDGGDELFAGYPTFQAEKYARIYRGIPSWIRRNMIDPTIRNMAVSDDNISFDFKLKQFIKGAADPTIARHFIWVGSFSQNELRPLLSTELKSDVLDDVARYESRVSSASKGNRLLYAYKRLYLAEDILTKVDRASMGVSLEARAPFLDHEFVEFVASLPYGMKLKGLTMKHLLKKAVDPMLPKGIATRGKKGFGIPVAKWLKGPLKSMAKDLFNADKLKREGFFWPDEVNRLMKEHESGRVDNHKKLWTLMMFEKWYEKWGRG
jgi:asparagine synthase (glutamine-hydrolysing)